MNTASYERIVSAELQSTLGQYTLNLSALQLSRRKQQLAKWHGRPETFRPVP